MLFNRELTKQLRSLGSVITLGIEMGVSIVVGFMGGRWLAEKFDTGPWLMWLGLALGIAAGFKSLYRVASRIKADLAKNDDTDKTE